jgi:hypothetical protein
MVGPWVGAYRSLCMSGFTATITGMRKRRDGNETVASHEFRCDLVV